MSTDSQKAVLRLLLEQPELWPEFTALSENVFEPHFAKVWSAIKQQITAKQPVTPATIARVAELPEDYIAKFGTVIADDRAIPDYISSILTAYNQKVYGEFLRGLQSADNPIQFAKEVLGEFEDRLERRLPVTRIAALVDGYLGRVEQRKGKDPAEWTLCSPWGKLNNKIGGFYIGDYSILAARPGTGKTSLLRQIRTHNMRQGKSALSFLLEMTTDKLLERSIAAELGVPYKAVRDLTFFDDEVLALRFYEIAESLKGLQWYLLGSEHNQIEDIEVIIQEHLAADPNLCWVDIDHIGKLYAKRRTENRTQEVTYISNKLRQFSTRDWVGNGTQQLHVCTVVQLNRDLEKRDDKRPIESDLKQSGGLEEDADLILFIYRDRMYNADAPNYDPVTDTEIAEIIVAKNRNEQAHTTVNLGWHGASTSFVEKTPKLIDSIDLW